MKTRKPLVLFVLLFPITFVVGLLGNLVYSLRSHANPGIDWLVVLVIALVLDLVFTWYNRREISSQNKEE
jgi:hypothetical protein